MAFRPSDLREAFFVPGNHAYRAPGRQGRPPRSVRSSEPPRSARSGAGATVPSTRSRRCCGRAISGALLRPGELICVSARRRKRAGDPAPGDIHMALLMVAKAAERGGARSAPSVRLVQDFGCPEDPAALATATAAPLAPPVHAAPVKRGRGRPPGSRNRKNGALPTLLVN